MIENNHLLLVEDEAIIALGRRKMLVENGFSVDVVHSGESAIERVETDRSVDLILMDIDLGRDRIDGTETARRIVAERDIPIVFLTSHSEREMVARVKGITRYGYVLKSSGDFVLLEAIGMAFEIRDQQLQRSAAYEILRTKEVRLEHLNRVLQSLRKANRETHGAEDNVTLLDRICATLVESSGYTFAWAVRTNQLSALEPFSHAGLGSGFSPMRDFLRTSGLPSCAREALSEGRTVVRLDCDNACGDCPFTDHCGDGGGLTAPIRHGDTTYGLIQVSLPRALADDPEEVELFTEIALDVGHSMYSLENKLNRQIAERRFSAIAGSDQFALITTSPDGSRIIDVNRAAERFLGYERDELLQMPAAMISKVEEYTGDPVETETEYRQKDGNTVWGAVTQMRIHDDAGAPIETMSVIRDISREKRLGKMYREVFDHGLDAIYHLGPDGEVLDVNEAACRSLGWSRSELLALNIGDIDPNHSPATFREFWNVDDEVSRIFRTTHLRRDGTQFPVEVSGIVFRLDGKRFLYGVARDITERERMDEFSRVLLQQAAFGVGYHDTTGRVRFYNDAALGYLGMPAARVVGKTLEELFPPADARVYRDRLAQCLNAGEPLRFEDHLDLPSGEYWFQTVYTTITAGDGRAAGVCIVSSDITEAKRNELLLEEREALLQSAQVVAGLGSWNWNIQTGDTYWSDGLYRIYGRDPASGPPPIDGWEEGIHPDDRESLQAAIADAIDTIDVYEARYRLIRQNDGAIRHVHALGTVYGDADGQPARLIGIVRDETKARGLLNQKELLLREAHHRVRNNLLTAQSILMVRASFAASSETREALEDSASRIGNMLQLYEKLYSGTESDEASAAAFLESVLLQIADTLLNGDTIRIDHKIEDAVFPRRTLSTIGIIVYELVTNATKYAFPAGTPIDDPTIRVTLSVDASDAVLAVGDNGIGGVPADRTEHFGLTLVTALTEQLGGSVSIESESGTTTRIVFPAPAR